MARNEQLIRQHKILQILERYRFGRTLNQIRDELVEELGLGSLHPRSVRRDLEALQAAGIDVDNHEDQRGKVWKLGPGVKGIHKIQASSSELIALSLGRDLLFPLAGTPFWMGIESFWNKMQDTLPNTVWDHYDKYRQVLRVHGILSKSYAEHQGMLKTINRAILEHRVVEIEYQSIGKPKSQRKIEPYAVVYYQSSLYIIAAACDAAAGPGHIRHWKLDRFRRATALDQWFTPEKDFNLEDHLGQSMGIFGGGKPKNFKVRISARAAPWVLEDPWHPQQKVEKQEDGSLILTVKAAHEMEIIPRVLALGIEAEVIEPAACRRTMAEMVNSMAALYA